ncbi:MAG: TetR/AcrR family transcriptional regulator, partial [Phycisphaerae bacterium]|nr:TetR/AcrR family transcriptional regulator [Phycisphaerae bacterium]
MSQDEPNSNRLQAILNAARAVFDAKGYADATVKEIAAARAGVSKGSIYKYFASKEDIFAKVFTEAFESEHAAVDDLAREELPAAEKLQRLLDFVFERLEAFTRSGK